MLLNLAQTRDRRPLRKEERQSGYRCVALSTFSQFTDSILLHRRVTLRRRDITVSRNTLACCNARHLRIKHSVQFIFAGAGRYNAQKNWAALSCRPLRGANLMCSSTLSVNCEKVERATQRYPDCRSPISQRSHVGNLRQTLQGKRGDLQEGGKPQVVYPLVRPRGVSALPAAGRGKSPPSADGASPRLK